MTKRRVAAGISRCAVAAALLNGALQTPAHAEMVLSKVIVDMPGGRAASDDVEVANEGPDRLYVVVEPSEIVDPGLLSQRRVAVTDPSASGLLVSPQRLILEPGQRRLVRVSRIPPASERDRVYRVTVKPVAGPLSARSDAIKVYVGYDVLVIQRPTAVSGEIRGVRRGRSLEIENSANTAWELFDGRQCDASGGDCKPLPATRLYSGATWTVQLPYDTKVEFKVANGGSTTVKHF